MNIVGLGTHIIECLRIARTIDRHGELFINRVYTRREIRYCQQRKQSTQQFAACWAAKEAVLKALNIPFVAGMRWTDVEVLPTKGGRVRVGFRGALRDALEQRGANEILVSMAHCRSHATAYAIALGAVSLPPMGPAPG